MAPLSTNGGQSTPPTRGQGARISLLFSCCVLCGPRPTLLLLDERPVRPASVWGSLRTIVGGGRDDESRQRPPKSRASAFLGSEASVVMAIIIERSRVVPASGQNGATTRFGLVVVGSG